MNAEHECKGAIRAITGLDPLARFQVTGYRFLEDTTLDETQRQRYEQDEQLRKDFHVLDTTQVAQAVWGCVANINQDVQVISKEENKLFPALAFEVANLFSPKLWRKYSDLLGEEPLEIKPKMQGNFSVQLDFLFEIICQLEQ